MKEKSFIKPILFMTVVTLIFAGSLATVNYITKDRIQFNADAEVRKKILYVFDIMPPQTDDQSIEKVFNERVKEVQVGENPGYALLENGEPTAYALQVNGAGLWGSITGYLGITKDFTKTLGLDFTKQSETPGLGGRIEEDWYKEQFRGIDITNPVNGAYIISNPAPGGNVDAISGATQTSNSVINLVNDDLKTFLENPEVK